jgi:hypothetical protein
MASLLLCSFNKRSQFFPNREDTKLPPIMLRSLIGRMVPMAAIVAFLFLNKRNLSTESFRATGD